MHVDIFPAFVTRKFVIGLQVIYIIRNKQTKKLLLFTICVLFVCVNAETGHVPSTKEKGNWRPVALLGERTTAQPSRPRAKPAHLSPPPPTAFRLVARPARDARADAAAGPPPG